MSLLSPTAYSTGVVNDWNNIERGFYHTCAIGMKVQEAHVVCHFQCCFTHLPHFYYRKEVQEAYGLGHFQSGIKHEPPEPPAFNKDVLNDWNIIESGITHEPPEPTCIQ
jgi:hypothetical protein